MVSLRASPAAKCAMADIRPIAVSTSTRICDAPDRPVMPANSLIQPSENLEVETIRDKRTAFRDELRRAVTSRFQYGATRKFPCSHSCAWPHSPHSIHPTGSELRGAGGSRRRLFAVSRDGGTGQPGPAPCVAVYTA